MLSQNSALETVAGVRNLSKAGRLGIPLVYLDLDRFETLAPALEGVDRIFMATGYTVDMLRQSKDLVNVGQEGRSNPDRSSGCLRR